MGPPLPWHPVQLHVLHTLKAGPGHCILSSFSQLIYFCHSFCKISLQSWLFVSHTDNCRAVTQILILQEIYYPFRKLQFLININVILSGPHPWPFIQSGWIDQIHSTRLLIPEWTLAPFLNCIEWTWSVNELEKDSWLGVLLFLLKVKRDLRNIWNNKLHVTCEDWGHEEVSKKRG